MITALACAGLGAATLFPGRDACGREQPRIRSWDRTAGVSWPARVGFPAVPPFVGPLGDRVSLRAGASVVVVAGLVALIVAQGLTHGRPGEPGGAVWAAGATGHGVARSAPRRNLRVVAGPSRVADPR
ncbi:hypothetical protein GCM10010345_92940 [Streptomyces canarius]|uniref:MFS transporter n=1 Tax=Streptomyces canarius TaxID=285453 RepID=A0ABQ3DFP5_9ACTN|nr:hypothetical protein GCM10010345_92940 [Streptomyces canarius]